ncbi:hypothetical protein HHK36_001854 [Tetracentron sinense]|uniref:Uncharacterized protein n=1 Tax=Tetracentron sinense TaxID=13715 RepID=A0A834ZY81_TETSI|nr:hypothetical protein HHK36_001854 [Tetracentron sinense]
MHLRGELQLIKKGSSSMADFLLKVKSISDSLVAIQLVVSDDDLVHYTLSGLSTDYEAFITAVTNRVKAISFEELHADYYNMSNTLPTFILLLLGQTLNLLLSIPIDSLIVLTALVVVAFVAMEDKAIFEVMEGALNNQILHIVANINQVTNAEKQLWMLIHFKGLLHTDVQELYRKTRSSYEKVILNDHELAELHDIEYSLWKLHYKHIDEYRNKIRQSAANAERMSSAMRQNVATEQNNYDSLLEGFRSFLSEATEFYQDLIMKIRKSYGLPNEVLFFNEGGIEPTKMHECQYSCHRCLICLGDLARYRELHGKPDIQNRNWSVAATHYLNASIIWPDRGNAQNQLAVLAMYVGDELLALYHCVRSLAVKEPFPDAWDNLILLFEKNRLSPLRSLSNEATFDFLRPFERSTMQNITQSSDCFSNFNTGKTTEDVLWSEETGLWSLIVRLIGIFFTDSSLEGFPCTFASTIRELEALMSFDDVRLMAALESYQHIDAARKGPFRALQVVAILIFTIHTLIGSPNKQKPEYLKDMQQPVFIRLSLASTFICMGRLVNRCVMDNPLDCNPLLPAILVFVEWMVEELDISETYEADEKCASAIGYFFRAFVDLLNQFDDISELESPLCTALWEDIELRGFEPLAHAHVSLGTSTHKGQKFGFEDRNECQVRIHRIFVAAMKVVNRSNASRKWIFYEKKRRRFYMTESEKLPNGRKSEVAKSSSNLKLRESHRHLPVSKNALPHCSTKENEVQVNEGNQSNLDVEKFVPMEEEEVILFKPLTRYNSAPLYTLVATTGQMSVEGISDCTAPSDECLRRGSSLFLTQNHAKNDASTSHSNITGSSCSKKFKQKEPLAKDSVTNSFSEAAISAGPPSLSAWVLNREGLGIAGDKGTNGSGKYGLGCIEEIASSNLAGLSISGTAAIQQSMNITFAPTSHTVYDPLFEGDTVFGPMYASKTTHYSAPPYSPPVPSAPLLPDDAIWFSGDSSDYAKCKDSKDIKETKKFLGASQVNSYSNWMGTHRPPSFDFGVHGFSDGCAPFNSITDSTEFFHWYRNSLNRDQANNHLSPSHFYAPANLGKFHDRDVSRLAPFDQWKNQLFSNPMIYLEERSLHQGFSPVYGADEQMREKLSHGYQRPSPYGYGDVRDLRSEQQLLLQYLKEKEWCLQRESQLKSPT